VKSQERVGQNHQPTAQQTEILRANKTSFDLRQPIDEPIDADIDPVSADPEQNQIDQQHPRKNLVLPNIVLQHVENLETLPKKKQTNQNKPVAAINFSI